MALDAIDLLAGLAPELELETDPLPAGVAGAEDDEAVIVTANDVGRLLRQSEPTVRRLIRTRGIEPTGFPAAEEPTPGPFVPNTPDKPGE
jgi:hypothetical protein